MKEMKKEILEEIAKVEAGLCKRFGVPSRPYVMATYPFMSKATLGFRKDGLIRYAKAYRERAEEMAVEPATEKQKAFIWKLASDVEREILSGARLNKVSASYVITVLKAEDEYVRSSFVAAKEVFDGFLNEIRLVAEMNK